MRSTVGDGAFTKAEAVAQPFEHLDLRWHALGLERSDPPLHRGWRCDAVPGSDHGVGRRFVIGHLGQPGVLRDHGGGARIFGVAVSLGAVPANPSCQPGSRRAAPQRVASHVDLKLGGLFMQESDCSGEVLRASAGARTIDQGERVVAAAGQFLRVRKTVVHGADVDEAAAGVHHRHLRARIAPEEEKSGVPFGRVLGALGLRVDVVEDRLARTGAGVEVVRDVHRPFRTDLAVPRQEPVHLGQRQSVRNGGIHRKQQSAVAGEDRIGDHLGHWRLRAEDRTADAGRTRGGSGARRRRC